MAKSGLTNQKLARQASKQFWQYRGRLIGLTAIIAVPLAVLGNLVGLATANPPDATFAAYSTFLSIIMNVALIWLIIQLLSRKSATVKEAYYNGTGSLVRFMLVAVVLSLALIPFLIGALIYASGVFGASVVATTPEKILLGALWILLATPTLWLLSRLFLAIYVVVGHGHTPIAALRLSNRLVKGQTGKVMLRLIGLVVASLAALSLPALLLSGVGAGGNLSLLARFELLGVQLLSTVIVLPVANLYLYGMYQVLERS